MALALEGSQAESVESEKFSRVVYILTRAPLAARRENPTVFFELAAFFRAGGSGLENGREPMALNLALGARRATRG